MHKLYKKDEVWFAVLWIIIYCLVSIPVRGSFGDESLVMLGALAAIAIAITFFVKKYQLETKYGLKNWPADPGKYLYFLPVILLVTGNLWGGIKIAYPGVSELFAIVSMLLIGYIEELIFRGFLFKAMLLSDGVKRSIIVSAVTFGIGHIVNLLAGQASLETLIQVFFAIAWGFIFTCIFYKSGSILPCVITHGLVNALSKFSATNVIADWAYMIATIAIALIYCPYLLKLKDSEIS